MIERTYSCNICEGQYHPRQLVGLYLTQHGIEESDAASVDTHICCKCLSSLQSFQKRCGAGFKCSGGPNCTSDHK
jgi:hypothetical protein